MARIYFHTLGCRLNQAEAERMAQSFLLAGHEVTTDPGQADFKVVNTCTVTRSAGTKSRRAAIPDHTDQKVIVTGCHSEVRPTEFREAALVVSNLDKDQLSRLAAEHFGLDGFSLGMDVPSGGQPLSLFPLSLHHTRAFVKVQDGCNMRCTFCMTTIARGGSRSRTASEIIAEISGLANKGCKEAVLTGVNAGSYFDSGVDLGGLMERILNETTIQRLRLSSLEPWNFKPGWIQLWEKFPGRMCRHLHMSLQSSSDSVLKRMARGYDTATYARKISFIREHVPGLAITTDLIAGFPGETIEEHEEGLSFVQSMAFADAHVFPFSVRPGTDAAGMPGHLDAGTKARRAAELRAITDQTAEAFRRAQAGKTFEVLWERKQENESWLPGLTDNYLKVKTCSTTLRPNDLSHCVLTRLEGDTFVAE